MPDVGLPTPHWIWPVWRHEHPDSPVRHHLGALMYECQLSQKQLHDVFSHLGASPYSPTRRINFQSRAQHNNAPTTQHDSATMCIRASTTSGITLSWHKSPGHICECGTVRLVAAFPVCMDCNRNILQSDQLVQAPFTQILARSGSCRETNL